MVPLAKKGRRGRKPQKGARLPKPKEAAQKADRQRTTEGAWPWRAVSVLVYGCCRELQVVSYLAVWPRVLGLRPVQVVVVRDGEGRMRDCYLFTTDVQANASWVIVQFAWRWAIEVLFRSSKQVLDIESPQHWCQGSVEKVAPWVWSMQSVIMVWYLTDGHDTAEAKEWRDKMVEAAADLGASQSSQQWIVDAYALVFAALLLPGCGNKFYPVEGKVVWADGTPAKELEGSQVVFESAELKISARGTIGPDGGFTMTMINPDDGVPQGHYKVFIVEERKPINNDWSNVKPALVDEKYSSVAKSHLEATVTSSKNLITLMLDRKKK
jgi:hypothetical protein